MSGRADFLVERRGFEPLTSAVQAPARLTGSSLPSRRETEDDVRGRTAVVEFVAPPTDDRFSFAIRSASRGNLVRE